MAERSSASAASIMSMRFAREPATVDQTTSAALRIGKSSSQYLKFKQILDFMRDEDGDVRAAARVIKISS